MPNMYASAVCSGKATPGGKKKRKKAMGGGMMNQPRAMYGLSLIHISEPTRRS